jgi:hypothetical protein
MTLSASLLWSLLRCVIIASISVWPVAMLVARIDASPTVRSRRIRLLLAVLPFFVPELLIGFNYRLTATQLTLGASPPTAAICTEGLYSLLMLSRSMAVGVAMSMLLPGRSTNQESLYSWLLLKSKLSIAAWWTGWLRVRIAGAWRATLIAWSVMALVTFQEFETAALMQIDRYPVSWSVWLFDAHAARLPLLDSLQMMIAPLLCELLILCPALCVLYFRPAVDENSPVFDHGLNGRSFVWKSARFSALLTPGIVLFVLWPLINNALPIVRGVLLMKENASLGQSFVQILTSTGFAIGATVLSMRIAVRVCSAFNTAPPPIVARVLWMSPLIPGLLGSLVLSLSLLALFQLPVLRGLYDTWLPMLLGQTLAVLPFAVVVVLLLQRVSDPEALHSTRLLSVSEDPSIRGNMATIRWRLTTGRWLLGGLVIAHRCFWDVTVASILRPVQVEPVITRLYNEMHYGRTEALMSLSLLATLTPLAIAAAAMLFSRLTTVSTALRR